MPSRGEVRAGVCSLVNDLVGALRVVGVALESFTGGFRPVEVVLAFSRSDRALSLRRP